MDNLCEISDEELDSKANAVNQVLSRVFADSSGQSGAGEPTSATLTTSSCLSTSPLMSPKSSKSLLPQQAIRSELRRDFLRLLSSFHKRKVLVKLYECPLVLSATFDGCDHDFSRLFLTAFKTPIGFEKSAIIRTNDVIELEFPLVSNCKQTDSEPTLKTS